MCESNLASRRHLVIVSKGAVGSKGQCDWRIRWQLEAAATLEVQMCMLIIGHGQ